MLPENEAHTQDTALREDEAYSPLITELTTPEGWGVSLDRIVDQESIRLDAEHYHPKIICNLDTIRTANCELVPLNELATIDLPGQFVRIWAQDSEHGVPYLNATDLLCYAAFGVPALVRYLSYASEVNIPRLIVREGMILVTCSGTIGRVFEVPAALDGWAGTHDIVRITANNQSTRGYLRIILTSPYVQTQILSHTHGGQIDHITAEQIGSCQIPLLSQRQMEQISFQVIEAESMKQQATKLFHNSLNLIDSIISDA